MHDEVFRWSARLTRSDARGQAAVTACLSCTPKRFKLCLPARPLFRAPRARSSARRPESPAR
jgi:hypothetical protein